MKSLAALLCSCILTHAHTTLDLKVGHQTAHSGVDDAKPRLSWRIEGDTKGLSQAAFQILVANSKSQTNSKLWLWLSGV